MIEVQNVRAVLRDVNPGLTDTELDDLAEAIVEEFGYEDRNTLGVPRDYLQDALHMITEYRSVLQRTVPQDTTDVIRDNDLGVLMYRLSELLNK